MPAAGLPAFGFLVLALQGDLPRHREEASASDLLQPDLMLRTFLPAVTAESLSHRAALSDALPRGPESGRRWADAGRRLGGVAGAILSPAPGPAGPKTADATNDLTFKEDRVFRRRTATRRRPATGDRRRGRRTGGRGAQRRQRPQAR